MSTSQAYCTGNSGAFRGSGSTCNRCEACYPNCDGSTTAPILNVADFTCFITRYVAGDPYANCNESTAAPTLSIYDFICFQIKYSHGCP